MVAVDSDKLIELQKKPESIRNICILAHVDHGKTTLADSLVSSNNIISQKLAGKLRYMDSRDDEQQRGITMKSSSIALYHSYNNNEYLLNIIDSPGHVDFSSEVSTAVRLCDGAIVIVDVIEGVCPQTRSALSMTYIEGLKPILVLNKMDRLITERKLTPQDAYIHLTQVLEQVNAVMGELFASDIMEREEKAESNDVSNDNTLENNSMRRPVTEYQSVLEQTDDSNLYFSPERGNVVFASAIDCWGFCIEDFAKIINKTHNYSVDKMMKILWGDYWYDEQNERIKKNAQKNKQTPLFVSMVLNVLWEFYELTLIKKDREKLIEMMGKYDVKFSERDKKTKDFKELLKSLASQWLPLSQACINMVCNNVPAPHQLPREKIQRLMSGNKEFKALPEETRQLEKAFLECSSSPEAPVIIFVSKMFSVEKKMFSDFKIKPPTAEELAKRRDIVRRNKEKLELKKREETHNQEKRDQQLDNRDENLEKNDKETEQKVNETKKVGIDSNCEEEEKEDDADPEILIGFARVYSGVIKIGSELFVLGPKHNPEIVIDRKNNGESIEPGESLKELKSGWHVTKVTVTKLYMLMGRDLQSIDEVTAGNVVGIGGLEEHVLKTATLSSTIMCPSFTELTSLTVPILRVALYPKRSFDLQKFIDGLKLLNQADCCAEVHIQETGEYVLNTAGEVHLERCLDDLKQRYAKVDITVSEPIIPFRETVVPPPIVDMVNETIENKAKDEPIFFEHSMGSDKYIIEIDVKPLSESVTKLLDNNSNLIKQLDLHWERMGKSEHLADTLNHLTLDDTSPISISKVNVFKKELEQGLEENNLGSLENIWSFGPKKCGPNLLINATDYKRQPFWMRQNKYSTDFRASYDNSIINGFQLATIAGPLCEEPMRGVCFIVKKWEKIVKETESCSERTSQSQSDVSGKLISAFKDSCRRGLSMRRPRLMTPMYSCSVLVNSDVLGKLYAVFGRRHGRVIAADNALGFGGQFQVEAILPVPESFHLARELRTQTSGLATPQLVFSHWEVIEQDPFWVPSTEEEYLHFGEKGDSVNRAKKYIDAVRHRKGLPVDSQLVTHAEKQRTLSKKK
ncbi:elongation factor-like GTPase 1 isoform X2 [Cotesia glomerata]|uniref:elongation factor-like GTPase 1 isoform X2 n=1 Tax=Cotesia glomerata TaxID=32391 RepID=UPI001D026DCA|nr:elongation factor-like GTPase 1 isoform X2 [Cotesia glomerata]